MRSIPYACRYGQSRRKINLWTTNCVYGQSPTGTATIRLDKRTVAAQPVVHGADQTYEATMPEVRSTAPEGLESPRRQPAAHLDPVIADASASEGDVVLRVMKRNRARRLYQRLGFVGDGETETHFLMRLPLAEPTASPDGAASTA
jgi:hypothetical protein